MQETKTSSAKPHGGEGSLNRPLTEASGAAREFAQQGAALAKDVSDKTRATAEETNKALRETYSTVTKGAADFNRQWIEMVRANTNASLDFAQQLLGVKSPSEFLELSSAHARKQFETFAEQTRHLTGLAQKVTSEAAQPLQASMKSALTKAA
jgi:phasin